MEQPTPPIALKPCPFCGKEDTLIFWTSEEAAEEYWDCSNEVYFSVTCDASKPKGPGGCGGTAGFFATVELAAEAWNRRTQNVKVTGAPTDGAKPTEIE